MRGITVEIGVEIGGDRNPQLLRRPQGGPAEQSLGGDVHHVRAIHRPHAQQRRLGRQAHAQPAVARQRHARAQHLFEMVLACGAVVQPLAGPDELHVMAGVEETLDHALDGHRDAVDLGRIGLGHERHPHGAASGRELLNDKGEIVHPATVTKLQDRFVTVV